MINPYVKERLVNYAQPRMDAVVENPAPSSDEAAVTVDTTLFVAPRKPSPQGELF